MHIECNIFKKNIHNLTGFIYDFLFELKGEINEWQNSNSKFCTNIHIKIVLSTINQGHINRVDRVGNCLPRFWVHMYQVPQPPFSAYVILVHPVNID